MFHDRSNCKRRKCNPAFNLSLPDGYEKIKLKVGNSDVALLHQELSPVKNESLDILELIEFRTLRTDKFIKNINVPPSQSESETFAKLTDFTKIDMYSLQSVLNLIRGSPLYMSRTFEDNQPKYEPTFMNWNETIMNPTSAFRGLVQAIIIPKFKIKDPKVSIIVDVLRDPIKLPIDYFNVLYSEIEITHYKNQVTKTLPNKSEEKMEYKYFCHKKNQNFLDLTNTSSYSYDAETQIADTRAANSYESDMDYTFGRNYNNLPILGYTIRIFEKINGEFKLKNDMVTLVFNMNLF